MAGKNTRGDAERPGYGIRVEKDVLVTMRDGVRIAVNIYRPDAGGKFPALLALSPYGKEEQELLLPPQTVDNSPLWDGNIEAGDIEYIVPRGYAHLIGDLRGTGDSEGEHVGPHPRTEGEDGYDIVEWLARQPWCDGNIGMVGYSYFGEVQLATAIEQPPHLKTIAPTGILADLYRDMAYPGGILSLFLYGLWDGRGGTSGFAPNNVVSAMMRNLPAEEFKRRCREALDNSDIKKFPNLYHLLKYPKKNPLFVDLLLNPFDGEFYRERSAYPRFNRIKVPVYTIGTTRPQSHFNLYEALGVPRKIAIHPPTSSPARPWRDDLDELLRWYDYWLKGIDTGIMDEPPVKLFVTGANRWRYEYEWPLKETQPVKYYLRSWQGLSADPEVYNNEPDCFVQHPLYMSSEINSLKYVSPPLPADTEVIGPVALHFYASIDIDDTNWIVSLYDVGENGAERRLSQGYLKASHRELDESRSRPGYPYHPHLKAEPVSPGEIYQYDIALEPVANMFKAGHRIKLEIKSMESPKEPEMLAHFHPHLCSSRTTVHRVYRDSARRSHLLLPVIGGEASPGG